jgi:hypothetical protein
VAHGVLEPSIVAGAKSYQVLVAWQLAYELERQVFALTATGPVVKDFRFCDQIRDASASAPRNIAEGFARFRPADSPGSS